MEKIIYRPHCGKCGGIIYEKAAFKCSYCGAQFDSIKIPVPEKLPIQYLNNMAEYIDRGKAQKYLLTYQNDGHSYEPSYFASALEKLPPADVIERSKVDNAIEEIEELGKEMDKVQFTKHLVPLDDVLEILKRNIEDKGYYNGADDECKCKVPIKEK